MITKKDTFAQLPKELERRFSELNIGKHLRKARITKGLCLYLITSRDV